LHYNFIAEEHNPYSSPLFKEAVWIASPELYSQAQNVNELASKKKLKLDISLFNYCNRMRSRCVPYGLFAGCSVVKWAEKSNIVISDKMARHSRLDMLYLCKLAKHFTTIEYIKSKLTFYPNSSIYQLADELRYIEYSYQGDARVYQKSSTLATPWLLNTLSLCRGGATYDALANSLCGDDIPLEEAQAFLDHLIEAQVIVSELEPSVTGAEFMDVLVSSLHTLYVSSGDERIKTHIDSLHTIKTLLASLDQSPENSLHAYNHIISLLEKAWPVDIHRNKLFHVDIFKNAPGNTLDVNVQASLKEGINVLQKLTDTPVNSNLKDFISRFKERYGDSEMPLLPVLDTDTGIGYAHLGKKGHSKLTDELNLPVQNKNMAETEDIISFSGIEKILYAQINKALIQNASVVYLNDEVLASLPGRKIPLAPSMAVIFRKPSATSLHIEGVSGASSISLLARFAHGDPEIHKMVSEIAQHEQDTNQEVMLAEISHLPEERAGNVISRPVLRAYEIPYLAKSLLESKKQIHPNDLTISVQNNRVVLRSKALDKEIIPRLSSAHNYSTSSIPLYRLLCDLQNQNHHSFLGFNWLPSHYNTKRLPRLAYKNIILAPATWELDKADFSDILDVNAQDYKEKVSTLKTAWKLPNLFVLAEGDREMLVDVNCFESVYSWIDNIKSKSSITLKEFIYNPADSVVKNQKGQPYTNQFIACLINNKPLYSKHGLGSYTEYKSQHAFSIGSEWIYYKIYCGQQIADRLLTEAIMPLVNELEQIDHWFFIRYYDPEFHIRLRLHVSDINSITSVIQAVHEKLKFYTATGVVWKMQTDTYQQEIERYGISSMDVSEQVFYIDSINALQIIANTPEDQRWLWAMHSIDSLLSVFNFTLPEKLAFSTVNRNAFLDEFKADKKAQLILDNKFRSHKYDMQNMLESTEWESDLKTALKNRYDKKLSDTVRTIYLLEEKEELQVPISNLLSSYVHMLINRLLPSEQRLNELAIYYLLNKYYKSKAAQSS
jgi:lantibiotic biosynthesis protein